MTDLRIRVATTLATHIGEVLTLELARDMARQICETPPDRSFDPKDFPATTYKGYVLALERFADALPELHLLHELQYAEVDRSGIPLDPDYDFMRERAHDGMLMQFTARVAETQEMVGNMRIYLGVSRHTRTLAAHEDTFYLKPEHRGGFLAVRLWQFAEACGIQAGAREVHFDSKTMNRADAMARYLKYTPVSIKFTKSIPFSKESSHVLISP